MPPPHRLEMRQIVRRFPGGSGVHGVTFSIEPGEVVCLLGPSGCGKSTTLRIAAGVERADSGEVRVDGELMQAPKYWVPPEHRRVGLMFQDFALFPHLSVLRNVMFGLAGLGRSEAASVARKALEAVGLSHLANAYPHVLSGGEQQRVALARAMAPGPRLMLMDEPFSGLDERLREDVRDRTMAVLAAAGASALIVTHDPEEAMAIADRIVLLRMGRVIQDAAPELIYANPADIAAARFFSDHVAFKSVIHQGFAETPLGRVVTSMPDGTPVNVLVRPDAVILQASEGVRAQVMRSRRVGPDVTLHLALDSTENGGLAVKARLRIDNPPPVGEMVNIALHPVRTLVIAHV